MLPGKKCIGSSPVSGPAHPGAWDRTFFIFPRYYAWCCDLIMGFTDDVMRGFVLKEMGRIYPSSEGWQYQVVGDDLVNGQEFLLTRRMAGRTEHVRLIVTFARKVTSTLIERFSQMTDTPPYAGIKNITNVLLVPQTCRHLPCSGYYSRESHAQFRIQGKRPHLAEEVRVQYKKRYGQVPRLITRVS